MFVHFHIDFVLNMCHLEGNGVAQYIWTDWGRWSLTVIPSQCNDRTWNGLEFTDYGDRNKDSFTRTYSVERSLSKEIEQSHNWSRNAHLFTVPKVSENFHTSPPSLRLLVTFRKVECHDRVVSAPNRYSGPPWFNPLKTKRRMLYLKTQFVPHNKHFSSRL